MKEIYHKDNKHLNGVEKIRSEAKELHFEDNYLGYEDAPASPQQLNQATDAQSADI